VEIEKTQQGSRCDSDWQRYGGDHQATIRGHPINGKTARVSNWRRSSTIVDGAYILPQPQRGVPFVVPQLCFRFNGDVELAEEEAFLEANGWNLLGILC